MPAILLTVMYREHSNYSTKQGGGPIAHEAHLGGALGGVVLTLILYPAALVVFCNSWGWGRL